MKVKNIVLVGCGNIGSRHLQALKALSADYPVEIHVVEPNGKSVSVARDRYHQIPEGKYPSHLTFYNAIDECKVKSDLCIIATSSINRKNVILEMLRLGHKNLLVEKIVCQSEAEYNEILEALKSSGARGWVNCIRRYAAFYDEMRKSISGKNMQVSMSVSAGDIGLGCVGIHFTDLFQYLTGTDNADIRCYNSRLSPVIKDSKRGSAFKEFSGEMSFTVPSGSITLHFLENCTGPAVVSGICGDIRFSVDEAKDRAAVARADNGWKWAEEPFEMLPVSKSTGLIFKDILNTDSCRLASLAESYGAHREFFGNFNDHLKNITGERPLLCPIT